MIRSVRVCWLVGRFVCHNFQKGREITLLSPFPSLTHFLSLSQGFGAAVSGLFFAGAGAGANTK